MPNGSLNGYVCFRIDLDYVPWDTPDSIEYGHGEPAMIIRLIELAQTNRSKLHFFASPRVFHAFPTVISLALEAEHPVDLLSKHPNKLEEELAEVAPILSPLAGEIKGFALKESWPKDLENSTGDLKFLSAKSTSKPKGIRLFQVQTASDREAMRLGQSAKVWGEDLKIAMRDAASRRNGLTICVRPQVLARFDPSLSAFGELMKFAGAIGLPQETLRTVYAQLARE